MRGTDRGPYPRRWPERITPACAGNSIRRCCCPCGRPDHPRVCGEQRLGMEKRAARRGSPPRVRGTAFAVSANIFISRITPACAGNSSYVTAGTASIKDHPRVCGEQVHVPLHTFPVPGSPPRVRGTVSFGFGLDSDSRITPACAGNRGGNTPPLSTSWDHPRVCGEQRFQNENLIRR